MVLVLHPRLEWCSFKFLGLGIGENKLKIFSKILARNKKVIYLCAPQEREFIEILSRWFERKRGAKVSKKNFTKNLRDNKRIITFAPASRNTKSDRLGKKNKNDTFIDILNWQPFWEEILRTTKKRVR